MTRNIAPRQLIVRLLVSYTVVITIVDLAGGIGYMGIALVMTLIFTLTSAVLWQIDFGRNPIGDTRQKTVAGKLATKAEGDADC